MGKIVSTFFMSLDGAIEGMEDWHFHLFDDEMGAAMGSLFEGQEAFLMGRVMWVEWSNHWPNETEDKETAALFNESPKYVISNTLENVDAWSNSTLIRGDNAAAEVSALKQRTEGNILMSGSPTTVEWLLREGLLDELHLLLHPVVYGKGKRLFEFGNQHNLELVSAKPHGNGVINLTYRPAAG